MPIDTSTLDISPGYYGSATIGPDTRDWTREDWNRMFEDRITGDDPWIGASTTATVIGRNKYRSPLELWAARHAPHTVDKFDGNLATRIGDALEPMILAEAEREIGHPCHAGTHVLYHSWADRMGCNLDGWCPELSVPVECKSIGAHFGAAVEDFSRDGYAAEGTHLHTYWVQVQAQIAITGANFGYIAILCDRDFHAIMVPRDDMMIDRLTSEVPAWVERHMIGGAEPNASHPNDRGVITNLRKPMADYKRRVDMPELEDLAMQAAEARRRRDEAGDEYDAIRARIAQQMGEFPKIRAGQYTVSRSVSTRKRVNYKQACADAGIDLDRYTTEYPSERMYLRRSKK